MTDLDRRLEGCFMAVFPSLDREAVRTASPDTVPDWDSIATVTLLAAVEDEFGVAIDVADIEEPSFARIRQLVQAHAPRA